VPRAPVPVPAEASARTFVSWTPDCVTALGPETWADPVADLAQLLFCFGRSVGRDAYFEIDAARHRPHEFLLLVGESSRARKGTSWDHARRLICQADPRSPSGSSPV